ncbi:MAG: hypothetical protein ACOCRK_04020 [bacterium]
MIFKILIIAIIILGIIILIKENLKQISSNTEKEEFGNIGENELENVPIRVESFTSKKIEYSNGETYYVDMDRDNSTEAVKVLKKLNRDVKTLIDHLAEDNETDYRIKNYFKRWKDKINEGNPDSSDSSYTVNKGMKFVICLRDKETGKIHDYNVLMFVTLHEIAHVMCNRYGHPSEFWDTFKWLLKGAERYLRIRFSDYSMENKKYCNTTIHTNPLYDWKCVDKSRCEL